MKFWEMDEPSLGDYKHTYINGKLNHPFRLPAVNCEACGESVWEFDVVLPYQCPLPLRKNRLLTNCEAEVSMKEFRKLERDIVRQLRRDGIERPTLAPSACLQPGFLDVPASPTADFLWSDLWSGITCIIVAKRIKSLMESAGIRDIAFCPVTMRKVGRRSPKTPPRVPRSGEPEDLMNDIKSSTARNSTFYYFQLLVCAESGYPPGTEPGPVCKVCGQERQDWKSESSLSRKRWATQQKAWKELTHEVLLSVWKGSPIFRLAAQGTVLITDELKDRLQEIGATNVVFKEYPAPQPAARKRRHQNGSAKRGG